MLLIGDGKLNRGGYDERIRLVESDVLRLPFEDGVFDAVTIAFGLRNLPDYQAGVSEMARVLKPGGRLLVLEFCPPSGGLYLKAYQFYLRRVMPVIGAAVSGSTRAYRYLASSIGEFITADAVRELMDNATLADFQAHKLTGGIAFIYCGTK
jgi:demethylmenaquinone methyltransferase/2-methoxy-6-polyprenyl-1,4-benzoquinol methylase